MLSHSERDKVFAEGLRQLQREQQQQQALGRASTSTQLEAQRQEYEAYRRGSHDPRD
jgi:hypothetical protein